MSLAQKRERACAFLALTLSCTMVPGCPWDNPPTSKPPPPSLEPSSESHKFTFADPRIGSTVFGDQTFHLDFGRRFSPHQIYSVTVVVNTVALKYAPQAPGIEYGLDHIRLGGAQWPIQIPGQILITSDNLEANESHLLTDALTKQNIAGGQIALTVIPSGKSAIESYDIKSMDIFVRLLRDPSP